LWGFEPNHSVSYPCFWNATVAFSEHSGTTARSGFNESKASAFLLNPIWQFHVTIRIGLASQISGITGKIMGRRQVVFWICGSIR
jgi:hypothetical protein